MDEKSNIHTKAEEIIRRFQKKQELTELVSELMGQSAYFSGISPAAGHIFQQKVIELLKKSECQVIKYPLYALVESKEGNVLEVLLLRDYESAEKEVFLNNVTRAKGASEDLLFHEDEPEQKDEIFEIEGMWK